MNPRKSTAFVVAVMAIVVGASCIPWLRQQKLFSVFVGFAGVILFGLIVISWIRGAAAFWSGLARRLQYPAERWKFNWRSPRLRFHLVGWPLVVIVVLTAPHFVAVNEGSYKLAVRTAHQSPRFNEVLGAPVHEAWYSEGKIVYGEPARSTLSITVRGQKRQGTLRVQGIRANGQWRLTELTLELAQPDERIDLLSKTDGNPCAITSPR